MQEGIIPKEEYKFGELHGGRRYKRKKRGAGREESHSEIEEREPYVLF
jgi:hypothetical protein